MLSSLQLKGELEQSREAFQIERHAMEERAHKLRLDELRLTETQQRLDIIQ